MHASTTYSLRTCIASTRRSALALLAVLLALAATTSAEPLPSAVRGVWRITRILPTRNTTCWSAERAQSMIGTTLTYKPDAMVWRDGPVPLDGITTREVSSDTFRRENSGDSGAADFDQLGIHAKSVLEVDMQHEDMDITGATTEVPGDSVLVAGPNRIIVSACGVYFEAVRSGFSRTAMSKGR